jgi:hypothetical protein
MIAGAAIIFCNVIGVEVIGDALASGEWPEFAAPEAEDEGQEPWEGDEGTDPRDRTRGL